MDYMKERYVKIKSKGFFFTLMAILLLIPLIFFITFYLGYTKTKSIDTIGRTRCERLYYFVEDIKRDLERAVVIFGRRAAIYAISDIVSTGNNLSNYTFNCSENCVYTNCDDIQFNVNGSEAALAELMICGTLRGEIVPYMQNHTFPLWIEKMEDAGKDMHFRLNMSLIKLEIVPIDAWNFATIPTFRVKIWDESEMCYYEDSSIVVQSNTSILGLEDPLYPLYTNGRISKYIRNCTTNLTLDLVAGCSSTGNGTATGNVIFRSRIGDGSVDDLRDFCDNTSAEVLNNLILVIDEGFGGGYLQKISDCLNISSEKHFAGLIDYGNIGSLNLNVTIPWITGTGELDNVTPNGPSFPQSCPPPPYIENYECVTIKNIDSCGIHQVLIGFNSSLLNTTCYQISDIEENYNSFCSENKSDGPSFFDRLDGRLYLSSKYKEQSHIKFGNSLIGIESFVNPYILDDYSITVNKNATWIDYLYWQNDSGCDVQGFCKVGDYGFMLDCPHAYKYQVDTECEQVTGCCGDGVCNVNENCITCSIDCICLGCPTIIEIDDCKTCSGPTDCNVTYSVGIKNQTGSYMNLSVNPTIYITVNAITDSYTMDKREEETGKYYYKKIALNKNDDINATVYVSEHNCPGPLTNATSQKKVNLIDNC